MEKNYQELIEINKELKILKMQDFWFLIRKQHIQFFNDSIEYEVISYHKDLIECLKKSISYLNDYSERLENLCNDFCQKFNGNKYPSRDMEMKKDDINFDNFVEDKGNFYYLNRDESKQLE